MRKEKIKGIRRLKESTTSKFVVENEKGFYYNLGDWVAKWLLIDADVINRRREKNKINLSNMENGIILNLSDYKRVAK